MLWRVRATLPDRPGALAGLAVRCGEAGVNILTLQVFPGIESVTDELVVSAPDDWDDARLSALITDAGADTVVAAPCSDAALTDQPTRYVEAARAILDRPNSFPDVVAHLFDAEPGESDDDGDVMEMSVGEVLVQVRRTAPFTGTERARGAAMAELVSDVLQRGREWASIGTAGTPRRLGSGMTPSYVVQGDSVVAVMDGSVVGRATVQPADSTAEPDLRHVTLDVDASFQRRGIGTRLLGDVCRLAHTLGADEILLTTRSDNQAVLPMVMAAGMRGRIRMAADQLTVRVQVRDLKPL